MKLLGSATMGHGMSATIKELFNVDSDRGQHLTTMDLECSTDSRSGSVSGRRQKETSLLGKHRVSLISGVTYSEL